MRKKYSVFIDGQSGTTGLQIYERLKNHEQISLLEIDPQDRKNQAAKEKLISEADITFLCLPDNAAIEAAQIAKRTNSRVIDASSAHRCNESWVYGLPELDGLQRNRIASAQMVANPGCYATGALLLLKPLIRSTAIDPKTAIHIYGFSGYSGGGKAMIEYYEKNSNLSGFSLYGLNFDHKHIPEICKWSGLENRPTFFPSIVNCRQGMLVLIALNRSELSVSTTCIADIISDYYSEEHFVRFDDSGILPNEQFKYIEGLANTNYCDLSVFESTEYEQVLLVAKLDNLGKGASGAAVQNMNIMLGLPEQLGIEVNGNNGAQILGDW